MHVRSVDMPGLRSEMAAYLKAFGPTIYLTAIEAGVQDIKPDGLSPAQQAVVLSEHETRRLGLGDLYYVNEDMVALARTAATSMPEFSINDEDLPSPAGFVVFESPLDVYDEGRGEVQIVSASWGPCWGSHAKSLWVTWYTCAASVIEQAQMRGSVVHRQRVRLFIHTESILSLEGITACRASGGERMSFGERDPHSQASWLATLRTIWLLMGQSVGSVNDARFDRAASRRLARDGIPATRVRVITLRRAAGEGSGPSDREFHHRWIVRGHWRQQWIPSRSVHRPTWIAPHVKGPDGAPLLGGEKVYALKR